MENNSERSYTINTVKNAMEILRLFTKEKFEWNLSDLARELQLNISNTKRLVKSLEKHDYLYRNPTTKRYQLGFMILHLSSIITSTMEIHREAKPILQMLAKNLGEAIHLGVLEGNEIVYLDKLEPNHPIRLASHIGKRNPSYCTACGKIMLAYQKQQTLQTIVQEFETKGYIPYGKNTVKNSKQLLSQLKSTQELGYAICIDEFGEGISIGAPVYDYSGKVIAAISVTGPAHRMERDKISIYTKQIKNACKLVSEKLGYYNS